MFKVFKGFDKASESFIQKMRQCVTKVVSTKAGNSIQMKKTTCLTSAAAAFRLQSFLFKDRLVDSRDEGPLSEGI